MKTLDEVTKIIQDLLICEDDIAYAYHVDDALYYLKEYQTIKQKTGKWIFIDSNTVNGKCSECGYESHLYENDVYGEPYCPNCGVKMEIE